MGRGPTRVFTTLHGHSGRVNCVRWIVPSPSRSRSERLELVSGGGDGKVIVWSGEGGEVSGWLWRGREGTKRRAIESENVLVIFDHSSLLIKSSCLTAHL